MRQVTVANSMNIPLIGVTTKKQRTLVPTNDWVFVELLDPTENDLIQLPTGGEGWSSTPEAIVIAVGPSCKTVQMGDVVKHIGRSLDFVVDGKKYYMLRDAPPEPGSVFADPSGAPLGMPYIIAVIRNGEAVPS